MVSKAVSDRCLIGAKTPTPLRLPARVAQKTSVSCLDRGDIEALPAGTRHGSRRPPSRLKPWTAPRSRPIRHLKTPPASHGRADVRRIDRRLFVAFLLCALSAAAMPSIAATKRRTILSLKPKPIEPGTEILAAVERVLAGRGAPFPLESTRAVVTACEVIDAGVYAWEIEYEDENAFWFTSIIVGRVEIAEHRIDPAVIERLRENVDKDHLPFHGITIADDGGDR
jgi:hypothetical protein